MSAEELERLLWDRIDGTLEAADAERLRRLMADEAGAGRLAAEVEALAARLDGVEEAEPPPALGDDIRRAVRAEAAPATGRGRGWRWPVRRLVYLAAALVFALLGYRLMTGDPERDAGPFVGTAGLEAPAPQGAEVRLELPRSAGALTLTRGDGVKRLELELAQGAGPARLRIEGPGVRVGQARREGGATFELRRTERGVEVEIEGPGTVALELLGGGELAVTVDAAGETLVSHRF